jgi:hypothetical protein
VKRLNLKLLAGVLLTMCGLGIIMTISGTLSNAMPQVVSAAILIVAGVIVQLWAGKKK